MKKHLRILQPALVIGMGIVLAIAAAIFPLLNDPQPAVSALQHAPTPTATIHAVSQAGSTDGITILGFLIVAIVIIPILLRKQVWTK